MKKITNSLLIVFFITAIQNVPAQETLTLPKPTPKPIIQQTSTSNLQYLKPTGEISFEKRQEAFAKLLEGQRYIWGLSKARTDAEVDTKTKLAKDSLVKAINADPTLSEGYTALAELTYKSPPFDLDEAIRLSKIAIQVNADNFGGHQILARIYTIKSRLNQGIVDAENAEKAIASWKQVARLDPRNAEAYAFLNELYDKTNKPKERIEVLKKWLSSVAPIDDRFYSRFTGNKEDLSPENALVKLGSALLRNGENREAVEILSRAVSDNPKSEEAIELLSRALENADSQTSKGVTESLQQAIYANPENIALISLLAEIRYKSGNITEAAKLLRESSDKLKSKNKLQSANLLLTLGDIYVEAERFEEAAATYRETFPLLGIEKKDDLKNSEREYAVYIFDKILQAYKLAENNVEYKNAIAEASALLGKDDQYADKKLIKFYRENGQRSEALQAVRQLRQRTPQDYELLLSEVEILTENGKVDEGVALLEALIGNSQGENNTLNSPVLYDDYVNYLYISNFYSQANRGKDAVEAANKALTIARNDDRKMRAKLSLATAFQISGNHLAAETQLREILAQDQNNAVALNNLGYFLLERNIKLNEALELIQKAVDRDPTNPSFLDSLGWAYFKLNKFAEAEKYLKEALKFDETATIIEHLGDVYAKQGNIEFAKKNWTKALKMATAAEDINRLKTKLGEKSAK